MPAKKKKAAVLAIPKRGESPAHAVTRVQKRHPGEKVVPGKRPKQ